MGLLMVFDTTSGEALDRGMHISMRCALLKQIAYGCLSFIVACLVPLFGYRAVLKITPWCFGVLLLCLLLVFMPGIGIQINGAYRWMQLGPIRFQPSELMKIIMPLSFLHFYFKWGQTITLKRFYSLIALYLLPLFLIILEPDNGTALILIVTMMVLFFISRIPWTYWALPLTLFAIVGAGLALQMPHVKHRLAIYFNPELDLLGKGHQPYQAKIATGSGRLWGRGVGESLQKLNYLPTARSDYIAAIYAEEFGFVGILFLVLLYMIMAYSGFRISSLVQEKQAFYLSVILTFLVVFQAFLNLGVVSGLLPSKGTNLPFFSQGGSSLIANAFALSLVMSSLIHPCGLKKQRRYRHQRRASMEII